MCGEILYSTFLSKYVYFYQKKMRYFEFELRF